jgi:PIN domain nuclease of toxin-antitoxin system
VELLLDTHTFLWWLAGDKKLTVAAQAAIADAAGKIYVSAASVWEISAKHRLGKLPGVAAIARDMDTAITTQAFRALPITAQHAKFAGGCPVFIAIRSTGC